MQPTSGHCCPVNVLVAPDNSFLLGSHYHLNPEPYPGLARYV